ETSKVEDSQAETLPLNLIISNGEDLDEQPVSVSKNADLCPECGQATFVFAEGCKKCHSCGYSMC
ncbi:MAG: hypothetical protein V1808_01960, partial [Candidatus Daviesbacteria bacterium]